MEKCCPCFETLRLVPPLGFFLLRMGVCVYMDDGRTDNSVTFINQDRIRPSAVRINGEMTKLARFW